MEREVIQSVGFRNLVENGEIIGFQLKIRLPYYRGVFLSQLRPGTLVVDGESFGREQVVWCLRGEDYTAAEMAQDFKTHWNPTETVALKVKKPGGLRQGYHDLRYGFCFTSSYMPPAMQEKLDPDKESFVFMPEFGHHVNERRLIIV
ncbi:C-glycoside deglycosidase beta subunit domain-containing protein [Acutalibacter caecimuris]|uniref:C-glycoside deglycosidase beta subunit domain-containing protein n=1 Tax=Acutalibacter caecimuris TaxID=3093657 RepID=UPI002AC8ED5E|nr:DUF6379 domain-containing protein [Acutalibacter sp. M00118]